MKCLAGGLLPLLFASNLFALNLCDSSCDLSITFPGGGSIKAGDDIKITFGEGGYINNGSGTIAYPAGERLKLDDNESLVFQNGGIFDLGRGGNIKYKEMQITSNGIIELAAVNGKALVKFDDMMINGDVSLNIASDFEVVKKAKFQVRDGLVVATADLTFTNKGAVKGNFQFEDAVLTYSDDDDDKEKSVFELLFERFNRDSTSRAKEDDQTESQKISGTVYLDTDRQFTVVTKAVILDYDAGDAQDDTEVVGGSGNTDQVEGSRPLDTPVLTDNTGFTDTTGQAGASQTDAASGNSVSVASAGGKINLYNLLILCALLVSLRRQSVVTKFACDR